MECAEHQTFMHTVGHVQVMVVPWWLVLAFPCRTWSLCSFTQQVRLEGDRGVGSKVQVCQQIWLDDGSGLGRPLCFS